MCKTSPRTYCFHGDEHVLSLFLDIISKLQLMQVRILYFLFSLIKTDNSASPIFQNLQIVQCVWIRGY